MTSFSDSFPTEEILDLLGDDIELIHFGGGSEIIKGIFEYKYLEEEVGEAINIEFPTLEVSSSQAAKIKKTSKIKSGGIIYNVLKKYPLDKIVVLIVLSEN